jgi:hypothetical protein
MTLEYLDNLVKIRKLNQEPADQTQIDGLIGLANERLSDIEAPGISRAGKFSAAYATAHSLALAALRWHGYRSDNRYLVFQCLQHTVGLENAKWRVLDKCHKLRNSIEYEGVSNIEDNLLSELIGIAKELLPLVEKLGPIK